MRLSVYLLCFIVIGQVAANPFFKVFCQGVPVYRGRVDSIVNAGTFSGHVHKVAGGNHFSAGVAGQSPLELYNVTKSASCTTCSIAKVDNSNYWHPELYYTWPNGTFSLVPNGGLTIYYLFRSGSSGTQRTNPNWQPIPKGLRMLAGDPLRRTFDPNNNAHKAISFVCLVDSGSPRAPETNAFQTDQYFCKNGFRAQVFFPMCWNGKDLDSADHKSHMAYPSDYNGGDCPSTHPVRLPGIFFEAFYSVDQFPHGKGVNPFVFSHGDPTGYGYHGDFVNGWDVDILAATINDATCDATSTNNGNNVKACKTLAPYVKDPNNDVCELAVPIPLTENYGLVAPIPRLPGCNPITKTNATKCTDRQNPSETDNTGTFHILSKLTLRYLTFDSISRNVYANASTVNPSYRQVWGQGWSNVGRSVRSSEANKHWTMQNSLQITSSSPLEWETFAFESQSGVNAGYFVIRSRRNNNLVSVQANGLLLAKSTTIDSSSLFQLVTPNGGSVGAGLANTDLPKLKAEAPEGSIINPDPEYNYTPDTQDYDYTFSSDNSNSITPSSSSLQPNSNSPSLKSAFLVVVVFSLALL